MRLTPHDRKLPEVLVPRNQYSSLNPRYFQYGIVTGIIMPVTAPDRIVSQFEQHGFGASPDARVQQDLHADRFSMTNGSTRSWPRMGVKVATSLGLTSIDNRTYQCSRVHTSVVLACRR